MRSFPGRMRGGVQPEERNFLEPNEATQMNENLEIENWDHYCIVCQKSVDQGGGICHIRVGDRMVALCCPLCIETFKKDPKHYLMLRQFRKKGPGPDLASSQL